MEINIGLAFFAGLLSFVSPCVLPLIPAYVGYMGGRLTHNYAQKVAMTGSGDAIKHKNPTLVQRTTMLLHGLSFVLGFTVVFVGIGLLTTAFIGVFGATGGVLTAVLTRIGGVMIMVFGLHFMGLISRLFASLKAHPSLLNIGFSIAVSAALVLISLWGFVIPLLGVSISALIVFVMFISGAFTSPQGFWLQFIQRIETSLYSDTRRSMKPASKGFTGSFLMGIVFSAGWTPCIGPIYGTILTQATLTGDAAAATPLLVAYSIGLGVPFLLVVILLERAQVIPQRAETAHAPGSNCSPVVCCSSSVR